MPTFLKDVATKPRSPTLQVLMPNFLSPTVISRHDARLSSTTHCALRASRIIYNLTNLSRCYSFLLSIWTYAAPCRTAHFPSNSFQCSLVILQALSLTLGQNHQASWFPSDSPGSLSLSCQSHKTSYTTKSQISHATQLQHNITCSSAVDTYFTLAYHFCQELHRLCPWYFTYPMLCDTVQVSVLALHRIDAATPFPSPWDCPSTSWWYPSCFG